MTITYQIFSPLIENEQGEIKKERKKKPSITLVI